MTRDRTTGARPAGGRRRHGDRRHAQHRDDAEQLVVYGANPVLELLRSGQPVDHLCVSGGSRVGEIAELAHRRGVRVETVDRQRLDALASTTHHQGVVATAPPFRYADLGAVVHPEAASALLLDGVQDPRNLGAILRTARAAGVPGVVLPADRSAPVTSVVARASAGMLFGLAIARVPNLVRAMEALRESGFWLIGLVPRDGRPLYEFAPPSRPALVVGGEGEGLRPLVRRTCDFLVTVPMAPGVESLNAAVAASLALYEVVVRPRRS